MANEKSKRVMLHIRIVEATNIESGDLVKRTSDPFIKLRVSGSKLKCQTRAIKNTLHPVWNDDFTFLVSPELGETLTLKLKDLDAFQDDFLGLATIPLKLVKEHGGVYQGWFDFTNVDGSSRKKGSVLVKMVVDEDHTLNNKNKEIVAAFPLHRKSMIYEKTRHLDALPRQAKPIQLFIGTWNVGNRPPPADLSPWLPREGFDLYAIGAQECEYKHRKEFATVRADWQHALMEHFGPDFKLVGTHYLWEMRLLLIARTTLVPFISDVHTHTEATGVASVLGNKGGVVVALNVRDTRLVFVNSHLAAHQHKTTKRNANVAEIITGVHVGYPGMDILHQYDHVFWLGDLNYRLDYGDQGDEKTPSKELFEKMVEKIKSREFGELFGADQLSREMKEEHVFIGFSEGKYDFPPTFKVVREKELEYDEERSPAWCDRILWKSLPPHTVRQVALGCSSAITTSDHKPVWSSFQVDTFRLACGVDDMLGPCTLRIKEVSSAPPTFQRPTWAALRTRMWCL